jgi:hypothetical protein
MAIRRLSKASITSGAKSSKMWDQETSLGFYESIASAVVDASGQGIITFSNIPQNYTHLQLRIVARTLGSGGTQEQYLRFNDLETGYNSRQFAGNGSILAGYGNQYSTVIFLARTPDTSVTANFFATTIIDILDYASSTKTKSVRSTSGWDANGSGEIWHSSGISTTTNPITQLTYRSNQNYIQGSQFSLYGIRG